MGEMKEISEHINDSHIGQGEQVLETRYACKLQKIFGEPFTKLALQLWVGGLL